MDKMVSLNMSSLSSKLRMVPYPQKESESQLYSPRFEQEQRDKKVVSSHNKAVTEYNSSFYEEKNQGHIKEKLRAQTFLSTLLQRVYILRQGLVVILFFFPF